MANSNSEFFELEDEIQKRFHTEVEQLTEKIGLMLERETMDVIAANNKVATGDLRKSISSKVTKLVSEYLITCFSNTNYAVYVHDGTRPHFPPIDKIAKWIRLKGIAGRYSVKTHDRVGNKLDQSNEDRRLAFVIARSISKKGTKGLKFFDIALKQAWPRIEKEVQAFNLKNL